MISMGSESKKKSGKRIGGGLAKRLQDEFKTKG